MPTLLITIHICKIFRPARENASPAKPEYVLVLAALLNLRIICIDLSVSIPANTITISPGIAPSCLSVAGRAMIPAPTMVVERLKTAPANSPPSLGRKGSALGLRRCLRSKEGIWECWRLLWGGEDASLWMMNGASQRILRGNYKSFFNGDPMRSGHVGLEGGKGVGCKRVH